MGMTREQAKQLRTLLVKQASQLTDEDILKTPDFVEKWQADVPYTTGMRLNHNGTIYKVLQDHTSQAGWEPGVAVSLFAEVLTSEDGTPLEWRQPDSTNPYMTGDKVIFEGVVYESTIDNNVWSPADYPAGWRVVM